MSAKFVGSTGLTKLATLLKSILDLKADSASGSGGAAKLTAAIPFAKVDSTSTSTVFTATVDGITELKDGVCVMLMNDVVSSASGFTINVNDLGAKPVYVSNAASTRSTTLFTSSSTYLFVYNSTRVSGGCWDAYYGYDSNTIAYQLRLNNGAYKTKTALYRYMLCLTYSENYILPINTKSNTTSTSKTLTSESFDPFGPIWYYNTTTTVSADGTPGASNMWTMYALDLRYSFNTGSTLTSNKNVYIVATPQSNGLVKLHSSPISQTLPSTEDGKVYILLGRAYSTTSIVLFPTHPIYCYRKNRIQQWTGIQEEIDELTLTMGSVSSVNGETGVVVLDANDVGAVPSSYTSDITANTTARHSHSNKSLLDTYTQTEANLADAVSKKHSHSNKSVLDGITAANVTAWTAAEANVQSDWSQTDSSADDFIKNKPTNVSDFNNDANYLVASNLGSALDDNIGSRNVELSLSGTTVTTTETFFQLLLYLTSAIQLHFILIEQVTSSNVFIAKVFTVSKIDSINCKLYLNCIISGILYEIELTAANLQSTMSGTLTSTNLTEINASVTNEVLELQPLTNIVANAEEGSF